MMQLASIRPLIRSALTALLGVVLALLLPAGAPAQAQMHYTIDARFGSITFAVRHMGLFSSEGQFRTFDAALVIDPAHVERTRIDVEVAANSVTMDWPDGAAKLKSADFFNADRYPRIRFVSSGVTPQSSGVFEVKGHLTMRGVTHPLSLTATLIATHEGKGGVPDTADFVVTGQLSRAAYGMMADRFFISDTVELTIRARVRLLTDQAHG